MFRIYSILNVLFLLCFYYHCVKFCCDAQVHVGNFFLFIVQTSFFRKKGNTECVIYNSYILLYLFCLLYFLHIANNIPDLVEQTNMQQPFILILQESLLRPEEAFIIVERHAIPQAPLLKAVDVCFKLFYVLDIVFPWQSLSKWEVFFKYSGVWPGRGRGRDTYYIWLCPLPQSFFN